jgi:hypothetical protein
LDSEEDFKLFLKERADYIANQGYQSIYHGKTGSEAVHRVKALIKQYLVY